jgi:hypothetical protein
MDRTRVRRRLQPRSVPDETRAAEILRTAKAERRGSSRGLWVATAILGGLATIGFVLMWFSDGQPASAPATVADRGLGFGAGILIGVVVGIAVGYAMARQRQSDRNTP